jgi:hypothetical protein
MTTFSSQAYDVAIATSAARTATTTSSTFENTLGTRGIALYLNVSAASGTGGLTLGLQWRDPVSQAWTTIWSAAAAVTATTSTPKVYMLSPDQGGTAASGFTEVKYAVVPRFWRVVVTAGDSSSYTYSVGATLLP